MSQNASSSKVLVFDFGAQYGQLIARRVRDLHVYSEIVPCDISAEEVRAMEPSALILSGGPASVYAEDAPSIDPEIFNLGLPVLGFCYGHQIMAVTLGGEVAHSEVGEYGRPGTVFPLVGLEPEGEIGLYRIHALVLKMVCFQFVDKAYAPAFLAHVKQHSPARFFDTAHGLRKLVSAIAAQGAESISREAFGMDTAKHRLVRGHIAFHKGYVMFPSNLADITV
jgi:hypothetical protein